MTSSLKEILLETTSEGISEQPLLDIQDFQPLHCQKDALTNFFGWILQIVLAGVAFSCLIAKRYCEPKYRRRPWNIWWYDTSKQGIGAIVIHMTNVYLSPLFHGDPCTWYIINFLLDSTIGLFIIYVGIRVSIYLAKVKHWPAIEFGEYNVPKSWIYQTWIYVFLMMIVKLLTTLIIQLDMWNSVKNSILSPFKNQKVEVFIVMFIIPLLVNILIFWITDNFLMTNKKHFLGHHQLRSSMNSSGKKKRRGKSILEKVRIKYKNDDLHLPLKKYESESDIISSEDDPIIQIHDESQSANNNTTKIQQRSSSILG